VPAACERPGTAGTFPLHPPAIRPQRRHVSDSVLQPIRAPFRALARTLLPEMDALDSDGWRRAEDIIETMLADRPPEVRRQIGLFIRVANLLPLFRYGRPFTRLGPVRRLAFLEALQNGRVLKLRQGVWGLRTLVFMGYYGQDDVRAGLGYGASPLGWEGAGRAGA